MMQQLFLLTAILQIAILRIHLQTAIFAACPIILQIAILRFT